MCAAPSYSVQLDASSTQAGAQRRRHGEHVATEANHQPAITHQIY